MNSEPKMVLFETEIKTQYLYTKMLTKIWRFTYQELGGWASELKKNQRKPKASNGNNGGS